jgi:hypothetical protein
MRPPRNQRTYLRAQFRWSCFCALPDEKGRQFIPRRWHRLADLTIPVAVRVVDNAAHLNPAVVKARLRFLPRAKVGAVKVVALAVARQSGQDAATIMRHF